MSNIGRIDISPNVIVDIILETIKDSQEIADIAFKSSKSESINLLKNITKLGQNRHIDVEIGETECVIDMGIIIYFGYDIVKSVECFQKKIKENVEKYTSIRVNEVNVLVAGIINKKEEKVIENV